MSNSTELRKFNNTFEKLAQACRLVFSDRAQPNVDQGDERFPSYIIYTQPYTQLYKWIKEMDLENEGELGGL